MSQFACGSFRSCWTKEERVCSQQCDASSGIHENLTVPPEMLFAQKFFGEEVYLFVDAPEVS